MSVHTPSLASSQRRVLALSSSFPPIYGSNGVEQKACSVRLPAGTVVPDSILEISGLMDFSMPSYVDHSVVLQLGGQVIGQSFGKSGVGGLSFETRLFVSADRTSASLFSQSFHGLLTPDVGASVPFTNAGSSTLAIDFGTDQSFEFFVYPNNGDTVQLLGLRIVNEYQSSIPARNLANKPIVFWGDSWTEGAGSTNGGVPGRIRRNNPGAPVLNRGIGGQNSTQIADRFCRDASYGRLVPVVIGCGLNNIGDAAGGTPGTAGNRVMTDIDRMVRRIMPGVPYLVANAPQTVWSRDTANGQWIIAHNAGLLARYGQHVLDWHGAVSTNPDGTMPDALKHDPQTDPAHPNDSGYDLLAAATQAKLAQFAMV